MSPPPCLYLDDYAFSSANLTAMAEGSAGPVPSHLLASSSSSSLPSSSNFISSLLLQKDALEQCRPSRNELLSHGLFQLPAGELPSAAEVRERIEASQRVYSDAKMENEGQRHALMTALSSLLTTLKGQQGTLERVPNELGTVEDSLAELCSLFVGKGEGNSGVGDQKQDNLLQSLSEKHVLLSRLEDTRNYLAVLARAEQLKDDAVKAQKEHASEAALDKLSELVKHARLVESKVSPNGPGTSTSKVIAFTRAQRTSAFSLLVKQREVTLANELEKAGWPPAPSELQLDAATSSGIDKRKTPDAILLGSEDVRRAWRELMLLQKKSEKMGILPSASSRIRSNLEDAQYGESRASPSPGSKVYQPLIAVQCLLKPLLLRFYYHFDSSRSTNRLDKPEWYLSHMLSLLRSNASLFDPVHGAVAKLCNNVNQTNGQIRYDLSAELLHGLLRPLTVKLESSIPLLLQNAQLLSHTIMQTVQFDQDIRSMVVPVVSSTTTILLADALLSNQSVFEAWVQSEREFATDRLNEELESQGAWLVGDEEGVEDEAAAGSWSAMVQEQISGSSGEARAKDGTRNGGMKTTRSARAVIDLIDGLTVRYKALPSISHQLPFLLIQLSVLQGYAHRLERSLDAFESLSSAFARAIPGGMGGGSGGGGGAGGGDTSGGTHDSEADMVRGLRGLGRLLKACLSALFVAQHLSSLSAQSLFLIMGAALVQSREGAKLLGDFRKWEGDQDERELDHASLGDLVRRGWRSGGRLTSGMRPLATTETTAATLPTVPPTQSTEARQMSSTAPAPIDVWDKLRKRFEQMARRAQQGIEKMVHSEVLDGLRTYAQRDWDEDDEEEDDNDDDDDKGDHNDAMTETLNMPTPALLNSLTTLSTLLTHLMPSLPRLQANQTYRGIAEGLSTAIVDRVVFSGGAHRFSLSGAQRFARDVQHGWLGVVTDVNSHLATSASATLHASTAMGSRPQAPWAYLIDASCLLTLTDEEGKDGVDDVTTGHDKRRRRITLQQACRAAFEPTMAGPSWEEVVDALSIDDRLSLRVAREILRRRTECPW